MQPTLFIPKKLKVGFVHHEGTFTGKLAYVIYFDEKGKLRKESSWEKWRDTEIETIEIDNTPRAGFMLNKGIQRYAEWGSGRSVIRVHDPREFEFEIAVDNLIGLLMHSDVSKRDIMEKCVYAWAGPELVLLPVNSDAYQSSVVYTQKQDQKVSARALVPGRQYEQKKATEVLTYLGHFPWYEMTNEWEQVRLNGSRHWSHSDYRYQTTTTHQLKGKRHVFHDGSGFVTPAVATLSGALSDEIVADFAALVDAFFHTTWSQPVVGFHLEPVTRENLPAKCRHLYRLNGTELLTAELPRLIAIDVARDGYHYHSGFSLCRCRASLTATPEYRRVSLEDRPENVPFDPKGVAGDTTLNPSDFSAVKDAGGKDYSITYSDRVLALYQERGFGFLYYVLANGNHCPYGG